MDGCTYTIYQDNNRFCIFRKEKEGNVNQLKPVFKNAEDAKAWVNNVLIPAWQKWHECNKVAGQVYLDDPDELNEAKNMKRTIRLNESQLRGLIKESIKKVLNENERNIDDDTYFGGGLPDSYYQDPAHEQPNEYDNDEPSIPEDIGDFIYERLKNLPDKVDTFDAKNLNALGIRLGNVYGELRNHIGEEDSIKYIREYVKYYLPNYKTVYNKLRHVIEEAKWLFNENMKYHKNGGEYKLYENKLKKIIKESIKKVLNEKYGSQEEVDTFMQEVDVNQLIKTGEQEIGDITILRRSNRSDAILDIIVYMPDNGEGRARVGKGGCDSEEEEYLYAVRLAYEDYIRNREVDPIDPDDLHTTWGDNNYDI